ncbi:MAG: IS3 family transposase, partial [Deltaproteobacteria bacterium]|nr:IS3 family transposase [Deltaproteobacteria bacterium]
TRVMDRIFTAYPTLGYRRMTTIFNRLWEFPEHLALLSERDRDEWPYSPSNPINRKKVSRLMVLMGLEAVYPKRNLSRPRENFGKKYPYLLKGLNIDHPNQVWEVA